MTIALLILALVGWLAFGLLVVVFRVATNFQRNEIRALIAREIDLRQQLDDANSERWRLRREIREREQQGQAFMERLKAIAQSQPKE